VFKRHRYELLGLTMLLVVAALVWLSIAMFNQQFTSTTPVSMHISRAGLQLLPGSDVKVRGIIVGSVESITSNGDGADIKLRLQPDKAKRIPANVSARLVPKTIFGEKYVDLELPSHPAGVLTKGAVIPEDRTTPALEINKALDDLLPVLRAVDPTDLNQTLTALATGLQGRGDELGQTLVQLGDYVRAVNPQLPQLGRDLDLAAQVAEAYDTAAPDLLHMLKNLAQTSTTIVDERTAFTDLLSSVTAASDGTDSLLTRSEHDLITINKISVGTTALLAHYSPEYPCLIQGIVAVIPHIHAAQPSTGPFRFGPRVTLEFLPPGKAYRYPIDLPEFADTRGPNCYGLPHPPMSLPKVHYNDGTGPDSGDVPKSAQNQSNGPPQVRTPLAPLLGPLLGVPTDQVPDIAGLLYGPLLNGTRVNLR
jgi:phospholipid/cholesterol/gamma-HCH transport system substrate-binding protein